MKLDEKNLRFIYNEKNLKLLKLTNLDTTEFDEKFFEEI